jgi:DtxR family Mn-dependent transcriptional regulator
MEREPKSVKAKAISLTLTGALEDYLETILILVREQGFARVRDIAKARQVKSSSVSPALRRLDEMGLVKYVQREYVGLTDSGERAARRVLARHDLLTRFFLEVLQMAPEASEREACAMEHSLSPEAMDRLVRFFEFLHICPEGQLDWLKKFHCCSKVQEGGSTCEHVCEGDQTRRQGMGESTMSVSDLRPGQQGTVRQVNAKGAVRQRLLDMGLLPDVVVRVERFAPTGGPVWICFNGSQVALRREEAEAVLISVS